MEAALQRVYGIDLRDLYRPGSGLTYRRVYVLLTNLPPAWTIEAHLLDEVRRVLLASEKNRNPKPWPGRFQKAPKRLPPERAAERRRKLQDARRRARLRRKLIESGLDPVSGT